MTLWWEEERARWNEGGTTTLLGIQNEQHTLPYWSQQIQASKEKMGAIGALCLTLAAAASMSAPPVQQWSCSFLLPSSDSLCSARLASSPPQILVELGSAGSGQWWLVFGCSLCWAEELGTCPPRHFLVAIMANHLIISLFLHKTL